MAYKCNFCKNCDGKGCIGQMPGMGGPNKSANFIANCKDWSFIPQGDFSSNVAKVRLAPMTGAQENAGYPSEKQFYIDLIEHCVNKNVLLSLGDGTPDYKLQYGIEAVKLMQQKNSSIKASVFIKPYANTKIIERVEWALPVAESVGIDIDSYNIITMRNSVHLEKKTSEQLLQIKKHLSSKGLPFIVKGVFTQEDITLIKEVKPDVAYISNHGGRVETEQGSTAKFLAQNAKELRSYCAELWVDGGIRSQEDIKKASSYGVSTVLIGRPFVTAICKEHS